MTNFLSFDFSDVNVSTGPSIKDIPFNTPLHCVIKSVEMKELNGQDKFVIVQDVYIDPADDNKVVKFTQFVGPKQGFILARYLTAAGEDFRSLSGQNIDADSLGQLLADVPFIGTFKPNTYNNQTRHQLNDIQPFVDQTDD